MSLPTSMNAVVMGDGKLELKEVPLPAIDEESILVKNIAVAANPADWKIVAFKMGALGSVAGFDVAGEIVKVGAKVDSSKFKVGQKVYGAVFGASTKHPENGGFAEYSALDPKITYVPNQDITTSGNDEIPAASVKYFEDAASMPTSVGTAGAIIHHNLGINLNWEPSTPQRDHPILIWGGATSIGQILIQLAKKLHGYTKIIAVASKKHESLLKSYGADEVFDYHDADVIEQIKGKFPDLQTVVDCVSTEDTFKQAYKVASDDKPATVVQLSYMTAEHIPEEERKDTKKVEGLSLFMASGKEITFGPMTLPVNPEFRKHMVDYIEFVSAKINAGEIKHIPIKVYKRGLNDVQQMLDDLQSGKISGEKLVAVL